MEYKQFINQTAAFLQKAYYFFRKSNRDGFADLEYELSQDALQNDIFETGIRLLLEGAEPEQTDKILSGIINRESNDSYSKLLKIIQKEAVLNIRDSNSVLILILILLSFLNDNDKKEVLKNITDKNVKRYIDWCY